MGNRQVWGALSRPRSDGRIWRRQADRPLAWLRALLLGEDSRLALRRTVYPRVAGLLGPLMVCDASPWGMGAVLMEPMPAGSAERQPTAYFAAEIPDEAVTRYGATIGSCRSQALWEMLVVVVGARLWHGRFREHAVAVQSDSTAALGAAARLASPSPPLNDLGAELALAAAAGQFTIGFGSHIAGADNVLADALSRLTRGAPLPEALQGVPRAIPGPFVWRVYPDRRFRPDQP